MKVVSTNLLLAVICGASVMLGIGCVTDDGKPGASVALGRGSFTVEELNVLAIPVALNLDATPGPDGFVIKVHPNHKKRPKSFPITAGQIEVLMYDGLPGVTTSTPPEPIRTWTYPAEELRRYEIDTGIGTAYQFALVWEEAKPSASQITVLVKYTSPEGARLSSAPTVISVAR